MIYTKFLKRIGIWILSTVIVCCLAAPSVYAIPNEEATGYVEYKVNASVNFTDVVSVTLTNIETGAMYTHDLYQINEYEGNFAVPMGTYSVYARVIFEEAPDATAYSVVCSENRISVNNPQLATLLELTVNPVSAIEPGEFETESIDLDELFGDETVDEVETGVDVETDGNVTEDNVSEEETVEESDEDSGVTGGRDRSLLGSTIFYGALLAALGVGYFIYKRKYLE